MLVLAACNSDEDTSNLLMSRKDKDGGEKVDDGAEENAEDLPQNFPLSC